MSSIIIILLLFNPLIFALGGIELIVLNKPYQNHLKFYIKMVILFFIVFHIIYYIQSYLNIWFYFSFIIYTIVFILCYEIIDRLLKMIYIDFKDWLFYFMSLFSFLGFAIFKLPYWTYTYKASILIFMAYMAISSCIIFWIHQYYHFFFYKNQSIKNLSHAYLLIILSIIFLCVYIIVGILKGQST